MIRHFPATVLAAALFLPAMPALASDTVALRGDGYCPPEQYSSDPDCVPRGWRGTGRISDADEASSRERFPECMDGVCRRRADLVATSEADKRNQFPGGRPRQPEHLG
jgi:hypothetical protein